MSQGIIDVNDSSNNFGRRLTVTLIIVSIITAVLAVGVAIHYWSVGLFVVVTNDAPVAARDVVIHLTGETIRLGDLSPGTSHRRKLSPKGRSQIAVEFTDSDGDRLVWDFGYEFNADERIEFEFNLHDNGASGSDSRTAN